MKIHCIVVYTSVTAKQFFYAPERGNTNPIDPHIKNIQDNLISVASMLKGREGISTLATRNQIYYAYKVGDRLTFAVPDEALSPDRLHVLFEKIALAKNAHELEILMNDPEAAVKSKIIAIKETIEETKEILLENIEKLLARDEKISELLARTENLTTDSFKFSKRSTNSFFKCVNKCPLADVYNEAAVTNRL